MLVSTHSNGEIVSRELVLPKDEQIDYILAINEHNRRRMNDSEILFCSPKFRREPIRLRDQSSQCALLKRPSSP